MSTNGVPLQLSIATGTYRCDWRIEDPDDPAKTYDTSGEANLEPSRQFSGGVFGRAPLLKTPTADGGLQSKLPQTFNYPIVHGRLDRGEDIVLLDAVLTVWDEDRGSGLMHFSGPNAIFDSAVALVGRDIPAVDRIVFDSFRIQITGLDEFAATPPIAETAYPRQVSEPGKHVWSATYRPESNQAWSDDDAQVTVDYSGSATVADPYRFAVSFSPTIEIRLKEPLEFSEFYQSWIVPLVGIVCAATGEQEKITYLACSPVFEEDDRPPQRRRMQAFMGRVTQEPFASVTDYKRRRYCAIKLGEGHSLLELLRLWQREAAFGNPILETYDVTALSADQHPRARFLLLVQAIEGLCGYENRFRDQTAEYQDKNKAMLEKIRPLLEAKDWQKIKRNLRSTPVNLDNVLTEMSVTLPFDLMGALGQTSLVKAVRSSSTHPVSTEAAIRTVRNDLAHGRKNHDLYDLDDAAGLLNRVARAHLLRILNVAEEQQLEVLDPDRFLRGPKTVEG
ncbi:hypothetical protein [Rhodococcus sp. NBC_00297]|uniref:ApeA N-terminal domain 1-containing protein n=1 Tax=Rhodococcus sp. NBC_00297 TaxID=2976005 RepID=UPI002E2D0215|nr:hypothetical protein [Rhodococcus sp. NBC_00297]